MSGCWSKSLFNRNLIPKIFVNFPTSFLKRRISMTYTAGILVTGDEILKGQTVDTNSKFLCKRLFALGITVKQICVVEDDVDIISSRVAEFSDKFHHVITAGGIGPTHDDLTFQGIANAFNEKLVTNSELLQLCKKFWDDIPEGSPKLKLAQVPQSAVLHYANDVNTGRPHSFPLVRVKNVSIFPGVPSLLEAAFIRHEDLFRNPQTTFLVKEFFINQDEVSIATILADIISKHGKTLSIGSYPDFYNSYYKVKLIMQSTQQTVLDEAEQEIRKQISPEYLIEYEKDPVSISEKAVYSLASAYNLHTSENDRTLNSKTGVPPSPKNTLSGSVQFAIGVIEECLKKYSLSEVCLSFNGGKDCTALLHLLHAVSRHVRPDKVKKLKCFYIRRGQSFPEVELFIQDCIEKYDLDLISFDGNIKDALSNLKQSHPEIKAILMGTRRSDPHSAHLTSFSMTDPDWPSFLRVHPILDWSYSNVWLFLRGLNISYCSLYDNGYTSLGNMENTHPNPSLKKITPEGRVSFLPAHKLTDEKNERNGRN